VLTIEDTFEGILRDALIFLNCITLIVPTLVQLVWYYCYANKVKRLFMSNKNKKQPVKNIYYSNLYSIQKAKSNCEEMALDFLRKTVYFDHPSFCPSVLAFDLSIDDKKTNPVLYNENLQVFMALYYSKNESIKTALWNALTDLSWYDNKFFKDDFTPNEYDFIMSAMHAKENPIYEANVNKAIITDRLILRAKEKNDIAIFRYHYKTDGDFTLFTGLSPTNKNISDEASVREPLLFSIEEKTTHDIIGYLNLNICNSLNTGFIRYYIFKEYRNHGYCKEALFALVGKLFNNKLYVPIETAREFIYKRKIIKVETIRARIAADNEYSIKTVQSCGFINEATIHKTMCRCGQNWIDEEIFYKTKLNN
jgi:RimJ/RimL family protein N-acetyltransferase